MFQRRQPALYAAFSLAAGIAVAHYTDCGPQPLSPCLSVALPTLLIALTFFKTLRTPALMILLLLTGFLRLTTVTHFTRHDHISRLTPIGERMAVYGHVAQSPVRQNLVLEIDSVLTRRGCRASCGRLGVRVDSLPPSIQYGTVLWVTGQSQAPHLPRNPGAWNARAHYQRQGIHHILTARHDDIEIIAKTGQGDPFHSRIIYPLRRRLRQSLYDHAGAMYAPLLSALLLGDRSALQANQHEAFARAGIVHLLAVSGLHVGLILLILQALAGLCRLPRAMATVFICLGLIFYALLTEMQIPVTRAAIMGMLYTLGRHFERMPDALNLLGIAAMCNLLLRPLDLFSPGFQLSFSAVLGILLLLPFWKSAIKRRCPACFSSPLRRWLLTAMLASLAAQAATLPFAVSHFNRVPLLSLPINLLAIPWVSLLLPLTLTTALLGPLLPWLAGIYGALCSVMAGVLILATDWIASLSFSSLAMPAFSPAVTATYILLLSHTLPMHRKQRYVKTVALLLCLNLAIWPDAIGRRFHAGLWIQFDVGQGDAALLTLPRGRHILIDGGDRSDNWDNGARVILPYLKRKGIRRLQAVVLSHDHNDHLGGLLTVLKTLPVDTVYSPVLNMDAPHVRRFKSIIADRRIIHRQISKPCTHTWPGAKLQFFPSDSSFHGNNSSLALRILLGRQALLFTGDLESQGERALIQQGNITAQAVKVPHHGANTSSTDAFIQATAAHTAVISVGEQNRFGHPSSQAIARWTAHGTRLFRTDRDGALCFTILPDTVLQEEWR